MAPMGRTKCSIFCSALQVLGRESGGREGGMEGTISLLAPKVGLAGKRQEHVS
jgi:hypothetical protein